MILFGRGEGWSDFLCPDFSATIAAHALQDISARRWRRIEGLGRICMIYESCGQEVC